MSVYQARLTKIRREMAARDIDLLFLPPSPAMFYAVGIREEPYFPIMKVPGDWLSGVFIGPKDDPVFAAHWMLANHAEQDENGPDLDTRTLQDGDDPLDLLKQILAGFALPHGRFAIGDTAPARALYTMQAALPEQISIVMAGEFMDLLQSIKDEEALARMKRAAAIADATHPAVLKRLQVGMTVADLTLEVDYQLRKHGAEDNSFSTGIVFTRPDGPPSTPDRQLAHGDSITFDYGCIAAGYASDFGRSAFVGEPPAAYRRAHDLVREAQVAGMGAMKAGQITCEETNASARQVLIDAGHGPHFTHRLGHGIGVKVHERPFLDAGDKTMLQAGMTFTVEPSIRVPGQFANRVEDVVVVTATGGESINSCAHDLFVLE